MSKDDFKLKEETVRVMLNEAINRQNTQANGVSSSAYTDGVAEGMKDIICVFLDIDEGKIDEWRSHKILF